MSLITREQFLKIQAEEFGQDLADLVCSECGASEHKTCCSLIHLTKEHQRATGEKWVSLGLICPCERCTWR